MTTQAPAGGFSPSAPANASSDAAAEEAPLPASGVSQGDLGASPMEAELLSLLASDQLGSDGSTAGEADAHGYDGHVALALDLGALPEFDTTLDLLTSSHHLFDVPAIDVAGSFDDAGA